MQYRKKEKRKKNLLINSILHQKIVSCSVFCWILYFNWNLIQYNEFINIVSQKALF